MLENYKKHQIETLKNNVFFENESRKVLNKITPLIYSELKPLLNKTILKVNGELFKGINDNVNLIIDNVINKIKINPLHKGDYAKIQYCYLKVNMYSITLELSINFSGGNYEDKTYYCNYHKDNKYICDLGHNNESRNLIKFYDFEVLKEIDVNKEIDIFNKSIELKENYESQINKFQLYTSKDLLK